MDMTGGLFSSRILVIGEGWTGITTANEIAEQGFQVLLIEDNKMDSEEEAAYWKPSFYLDKKTLQDAYASVKESDRIEYLSGTRLQGCQGGVGNFTVSLENGKNTLEEKVGAIVLAQEIKTQPLFEYYGLNNPGKEVISLSELENRLQRDWPLPEEGSVKHIAFLAGFYQESDILCQQRIMQCVSKLAEKGCESFVYTRNLKLADRDLEKMYKDNIEQGAIYFKIPEQPKLVGKRDLLSHNDPVLQKEVILQPDLIVVEELPETSTEVEETRRILGLQKGGDGLIQENNVHRLPVSTNRSGIFIVGSARKAMTLSGISTDATNAAISIEKCFESIKKDYTSGKASIDRDKCCFCLTCYRCCPHGAISLHDKPVISSLDCQGCGICASECPREAISIVDVKWEEIQNSISGPTQRDSTRYTPYIIAYCCLNSAYEAGVAASTFNLQLPAGLQMVKVPCAGSINFDLILSSLKMGVDGIMIMGCHTEACKSVNGNTFAYRRSQRLRKILEEAGFSGERIRFDSLAENMHFEFAEYAMQMQERLQNLGQNPLAQSEPAA